MCGSTSVPAPSYCQKIAKNYRKERWSAILADVLDMSLQCAQQLRRVDDEIVFSLELISEGSRAFAPARAAASGLG